MGEWSKPQKLLLCHVSDGRSAVDVEKVQHVSQQLRYPSQASPLYNTSWDTLECLVPVRPAGSMNVLTVRRRLPGHWAPAHDLPLRAGMWLAMPTCSSRPALTAYISE